MEHTKGPWKAIRADGGMWYIVADEDNLWTTTIATAPIDADGRGRMNAPVLAAAPELLEACEAALEWFCDGDTDEIWQPLLSQLKPAAKGSRCAEVRGGVFFLYCLWRLVGAKLSAGRWTKPLCRPSSRGQGNAALKITQCR